MTATVSLSQGQTPQTAKQLTVTIAGGTAGDKLKLLNGTVDITSNFDASLSSIPASGVVTYTAKSGKYVGTELLSITAVLTDNNLPITSGDPLLCFIDSTPPAIVKVVQGNTPLTAKQFTFTAPELGDTITISTDNINNDITSKFTITNNNLSNVFVANPDAFTGQEKLNIIVTLTDAAGNFSSSSPLKATIDTTGPAAPVLTSLSITKINQPIFYGSSELGSTVKAFQDGNLIGTAIADTKTGIFKLTPSAYVSIGDSVIHLSSTDVSGNVSEQENAVNFSIGGVGFEAPYVVHSTATNYTIAYNQGVATLIDHTNQSADNLINFNNILFDDHSLSLSTLQKASTLKVSQFNDLATVYVGYFNRAPDAEGLTYWASREADGMSLKDISKSFFYQPETLAKYSFNLSVNDFVTNTYQYVLGRAPDSKGLAYWVNQINNGSVQRDSFVLSMINGARATSGSPTDAQYLSNKAAVSYNFAVTNGLNDVSWASDVISNVTDAATTVADANAKITNYANQANTAQASEFVVKLLGIMA
jgi:Domain of unknown function (DUF4214)